MGAEVTVPGSGAYEDRIFEIEVMMVSTPRIDLLTASRAPRFALHGLADG